jgi:hypothetical protein
LLAKKYRKGENMVTEKNKEKYLVISTIIFITYLLLGSFVVSGSILDLGYLIVFYAFIILRLTIFK